MFSSWFYAVLSTTLVYPQDMEGRPQFATPDVREGLSIFSQNDAKPPTPPSKLNIFCLCKKINCGSQRPIVDGFAFKILDIHESKTSLYNKLNMSLCLM